MSHTQRPAPAAWVGIDVSKDALDACLPPAPGGKPRTQAFANDAGGHAALASWADEHAAGVPLGFRLESTGAYGEALAAALAASVHKRTRLSKAGDARLRKALYLPALTAARFDPLLKAFFGRLVAAGKARMAAVGACMRKLLMIAYGVLKNRAPFDPSWASKTAP